MLSGDHCVKRISLHSRIWIQLGNVFEGLVKKVQYAEYGPSGQFSKLKITEEDQNRLLEFDWRLIAQFDEILTLIAGLQHQGATR